MEEARKEFQFDGPGSFTINLKSVLSVEEDVDYIEVSLSVAAKKRERVDLLFV